MAWGHSGVQAFSFSLQSATACQRQCLQTGTPHPSKIRGSLLKDPLAGCLLLVPSTGLSTKKKFQAFLVPLPRFLLVFAHVEAALHSNQLQARASAFSDAKSLVQAHSSGRLRPNRSQGKGALRLKSLQNTKRMQSPFLAEVVSYEAALRSRLEFIPECGIVWNHPCQQPDIMTQR